MEAVASAARAAAAGQGDADSPGIAPRLSSDRGLPSREGPAVSQRRNYGFERRRKADAQRAKQQAKRERKTLRAETGAVGPDMGLVQEPGVQPGMWEWFSPSRSRIQVTEKGIHPATDPPDDWVLLTDVSAEPGTGGPE